MTGASPQILSSTIPTSFIFLKVRSKVDGDRFSSAHLITNNLGHVFMFEISGRVKSALADQVVIHLGEEHLAEISLDVSSGDISRSAARA